MSRVVAGLVAAAPLSVLGVVYMLIWGRGMVTSLMANEIDSGSMTESQWTLIFLGSVALAPFAFGALSGVVYGWVKSPHLFRGLAAGLAVLFSLLAVISRTPMPFMKVVLNVAVALVLGVLVPLLSA